MLRYRMVVVTRDNALKRAVKRLTTATGSTAEFVTEASAIPAEPQVNLAIYDARETAPGKNLLERVPPQAKILYIVQGDRLLDRLPLFHDGRACSLFAHDERFDDDEFISTATKALRGEVFGLQKYFPWGVTTFSIRMKNHEEKGRAIDILLEYANLAGVRGAVRDRIQLVCDELMMNALYHAPTDTAGKELYAGRTQKDLAQLGEVSTVRVQYGCSGRYFGVSVRDEYGSLTREKLLDYLLRSRGAAKIENKVNGAGLGLITVLRSVSKLVVNLDPGHATEMIALFDMELFARGKMGARSLHLFTAPPHEDEAEEKATSAATPAAPKRAWMVITLLLAVMSALLTAVILKRTGAAEPAAAGGRTLTVFTEPADASVTLDGASIPAGTAVKLSPDARGQVTVTKDGFGSRTVTVPATATKAIFVALPPAIP